MRAQAGKIHLVTPADTPQSELSQWDVICLSLGAKVMTKNSHGHEEPRLSVVVWLLVAAFTVIIALALFLGWFTGYQSGVSKGKEEATLEVIQKDLESIKKQKLADDNLKKAIDWQTQHDANTKKKE